MFYGLLGTTQFAGIKAPRGFSLRESTNLVEHALINSKPRLEKVGENLTELQISIGLHARFSSPESEIETLRQARSSAQVLPLIFGSGTVVGNFVIREMNVEMEKQDAMGRIIACSIELTLVEFFDASNPTPKSQSFAVTTSNPVQNEVVTTPYSTASQFNQAISSAAARPLQIEGLLVQIENDNALETSNLQRIDAALVDQQTQIDRAGILASDPVGAIYDATASFRAQLVDLNDGIQSMRSAVAGGLSTALLQNVFYQSTFAELRTLTTQVSAFNAVRR